MRRALKIGCIFAVVLCVVGLVHKHNVVMVTETIDVDDYGMGGCEEIYADYQDAGGDVDAQKDAIAEMFPLAAVNQDQFLKVCMAVALALDLPNTCADLYNSRKDNQGLVTRDASIEALLNGPFVKSEDAFCAFYRVVTPMQNAMVCNAYLSKFDGDKDGELALSEAQASVSTLVQAGVQMVKDEFLAICGAIKSVEPESKLDCNAAFDALGLGTHIDGDKVVAFVFDVLDFDDSKTLDTKEFCVVVNALAALTQNGHPESKPEGKKQAPAPAKKKGSKKKPKKKAAKKKPKKKPKKKSKKTPNKKSKKRPKKKPKKEAEQR